MSRFARTAAAQEPAAGLGVRWRELLFDDVGALRAPTDPAQALLAATEQLLAGLADHAALLPERARLHWLEQTLGIPRLPGLPDEVVAVATAEPGPVPPVLPRGTELRAAKGGQVPERTYVTTDALTVLGAQVTGVQGYLADGPADRAHAWTGDGPFSPFSGPAAVHALDLLTDDIAFPSGDGTVTLRFPGGGAGQLAGATWQYSTAEGLQRATPVVAGDTLVLALRGGCGPYETGRGDVRTFLRTSVPADAVTAQTYETAFSSVEVSLSRTGVRPDGAFAGTGALDVTKELEPFGPVPRRGDAFLLRCDEAFGKQLSSLEVGLATQAVDVPSGDATARKTLSKAGTEFATEIGTVGGKGSGPSRRLQWQRRSSGRWVLLDEASSLRGPRATTYPGDPLSERHDVGGIPGHYLRLVLTAGDFGWASYLAGVARFAAAAATPGTPHPNAADLVQPEAPSLTGITISYRTRPRLVPELRTRNGCAVRTLPQTGVRRPFTQLVIGGAVLLGFSVAGSALGTVLSWYAELTQAPACGSTGEPDARWECWTTEGAWRAVDVLDGTRGMRQSGLVRFVTPLDWADGCPDADATEGRWLRLVTATPGVVGDVLSVHTDAVTARWAGGRGDPLVPLVPGQVKGLRTPVAGVRVTNPAAGTHGRAAETDEHYRARASAVVRTRDRGLQAWDYESIVATEFPEVAVVRCLPHTGVDGCAEPGSVGLVVLPRSPARMPYPSVTLADRIVAALRPRTPLHARVVVLCPEYVGVRFRAEVVLRPGVSATQARARVLAAVEDELHPLSGVEGAPFGRALYPSSLVALLEQLPDVDHVERFALLAPSTSGDVVPVDACRGLIASGGDHELVLREVL